MTARGVAVTGASGFIGRHLCAALGGNGRVIRIGRGTSGDAGHRRTDYGEESLVSALEGADAVVHLAGRRMVRADDPMDIEPFLAPNVIAVRNLVRAAQRAGVGRIVLASTIAVYSAPSGLPYREDGPPAPVNAYGLSKLMAEETLSLMTREGSVSAVSLRLAAVYGHGERISSALMKFADRAARGERITITGNPDYRIDQIYVADAVAAILAALDAGDATGTVNVGGGAPYSVLEIAETINAVYGNDGNLALEPKVDQPVRKSFMVLDRAREALGWQPKYGLREGLTAMRNAADADGR